jgi:hypothetical protein
LVQCCALSGFSSTRWTTGKVSGTGRKLLKARDEERILGPVPVAGVDYEWLSLTSRAIPVTPP